MIYPTRSLPLLLIHLLTLGVFSWVAFSAHPQELFLGTDGATFISLAHEQLTFFGKTLGLQSNMLQGLGNLSIGDNMSAFPPFWGRFFDPASGDYAPVPIYVFFAVVFFLSVLIMGWNYGFSRPVRYLAAWITTLLFFPFLLDFRIYPITGLIPHVVFISLIVALFDIAFWRSGRGPWYHDIGYVILTLLVLVLMLTVAPLSSLLIFPYRMASIVCAFIAADDNRQRLRKFMVLAAVGAVILLAGWVEYELGLFMHTSAFLFAKSATVGGALSPINVSILFSGWMFQQSFTDRMMGTYLFVGATLGAILVARRMRGTQRVLAYHVLVFQFLLAVLITLATRMVTHWVYPNPISYEVIYFPLYGLFAAYAIHDLLARYVPTWHRRLAAHAYGLPALLLAIPAAMLLMQPVAPSRQDFPIPAKASPLTSQLADAIGIHPGSAFAGRVVSMIPHKTFEQQEAYFYGLNRQLGNEHLSSSLWLQSIPTLVEYNQLITPYFFWFTEQFLQDAGGREQRRNWINFSRVNVPVWRMLGVRFILTPQPMVAQATLRGSLPVEGLPTLHLFELSGSNTQGLAARRLIQVTTLAQAGEAIEANTQNGAAVVFADEADGLPQHYAPIMQSAIRVERGGWHVTAHSAGKSMLVVPLEYSRCLQLLNHGGNSVRAVRVNAVLTGLVFDTTLDVTMASRIGIFTQPQCRWRDYWELMPRMQDAGGNPSPATGPRE